MDNDEKKVWSTEDIRSHRNDWSLAADAALFEHIQSLSKNFIERTHAVLQSVDSLSNDLNVTATSISNTSDKFLFLANTQFVENRVYDDEDLTPSGSNTTVQPKPELVEKELSSIFEDAFSRGIDLVDANYTEFRLQESDSEDEELSSPSRLVPKPKNRYSARSLPHVIGSAEFFKDDKVGLGSPSGSSDSSSTSSLSEDENEDEEIGSAALKPNIGRASLSSRSVESPGSMEESKSPSPADDMFGRYGDSLNSSGKFQPNEAKHSNQLNHADISNQYSKHRSDIKNNESPVQEAVQPSSKDLFSHHIGPAPSLFAPPPFNAEESSEDSDNESLFAGRKHNRNHLFTDDDEDDDDTPDLQNRKQEIDNTGKEQILQSSQPQEVPKLDSNVPKEQTPIKKLPAGAVSIFGRNMNPFPPNPSLFSRTEESDEDENEQTPESSSEDGFSVSHTSSTDFGNPKFDPSSSKVSAPIKKSLFDDDEDVDSKDFNSHLFKPGTIPSRKSSDSPGKPFNSIFSDDTEDLFSTSKNTTKSNSQPSVVPPDETRSPFKESGSAIKSVNSATPATVAGAKHSPESPKKGLFGTAKSASSGLFDSDDDLFTSSEKESASIAKSQVSQKTSDTSKKSLFGASDTVDFTKLASPLKSNTQNLSKKPLSDLFDDNEDDDDDDFLFSSTISNKKSIFTSSKNTPEATVLSAALNRGPSEEDLFSKSNEISVGDHPPEQQLSQNIFNDDEEASIFTKPAVSKVKTGEIKEPAKSTSPANVAGDESPNGDNLFSRKNKTSIIDHPKKEKSSANIFDDDEESGIFDKSILSKVEINESKEPPKLTSAVNISDDKDLRKDDLFSESSKISNRNVLPKKSSGLSLFDDEDESSVFAESITTKINSSSDNPNLDDQSKTACTVMGSTSPKVLPTESSVKKQSIFDDDNDRPKKETLSEVASDVTSPKGEDTIAKEAPFESNSGDTKRKPEKSPKPSASALSEIDKLKRRLMTTKSDDFSSDDSSPNPKPKTVNPGKLAPNRGHNINIAALMPGYKRPNLQKSEVVEVSGETLSNSESAPALANISSQQPAKSLTVSGQVPKSTSLPVSFSNNDILSSDEPSDFSFPAEASGYSHFLANDAMKKRAKISVKRRPPSQKARQEAAKAPVILDTTNGSPPPRESSRPPEDVLEKSVTTEENNARLTKNTALSDDLFSNRGDGSNDSVSHSIRSTSPRNNPPFLEENTVSKSVSSLFEDSSPLQSGEEEPKTKSPATFRREESDRLKSVSSIFDPTPPPFEPDDLFSEKPSDQSVKNSVSESPSTQQSHLFSKRTASLFDDSSPSSESQSDDLFGPLPVQKSKPKQEISAPDLAKSDEVSSHIPIVDNKPKVPAVSKSFEIESDDLFSPSTAKMSVLDSDSKSREVPLVSNIFDDRPPPFKPDSMFDEDLSSSAVDELVSDFSASVIPPQSVSSIFRETPPLFEPESESPVKKLSQGQMTGLIEETTSSNEAQLTNEDAKAISNSENKNQAVHTSPANIITHLAPELGDEAPSGSMKSEKSIEIAPESSHTVSDAGSPFYSSGEKKGTDTSLADSSTSALESSLFNSPTNEDDLFSNPSVRQKAPELKAVARVPSETESKGKNEESLLHKHDEATSTRKDVLTAGSKTGKASDVKKSSLTSENPLLDNLSDEDLFGSYSTKPVVSAFNKFRPGNSKPVSSIIPNEVNFNDSKSETKTEDNLFFETDNIEKLFPKVKIGPKKLPRVDPLSEDFGDSDEEDIFDNSSLSPVGEGNRKPEESSNSDGPSFKPAESMDDSSMIEESFKTAPSIHSDLDKSSDLVSPGETNSHPVKAEDNTASPTVEKQDDTKPVGHATSLEDENLSKESSSLFDDDDDRNDLFKIVSQPKLRSSVAPETVIGKVSKSGLSLFGDEEEDDDTLFGVPSKLSTKNPVISSSNSLNKTNPSPRGSFPGRTSLTSGLKRGSPSSETAKSQTLFLDEEEDEDLFSSGKVKPSKVKTVEPSKKKVSLPKVNASSIFGDDEDSDTELFAASLKKK
nr:PREDICTED: WASH complex subunit FAM21-like [Bemisia tabaci]